MTMSKSHLTRRSVLAGIAGSVGIMAAAACAQGAATQMPAEEAKAEAEEPKQAEQAPVMETVMVRAGWISNDASVIDPFYGDLLVASFEEAHPNIKVDWEGAPAREHHAKLATQLAANEAPDVFHSDGVRYALFRDSGYINDLAPFLQRDAGTLQGVIGPEFFRDPDGSTWGISSSIGGVASAYNTAHFDKFGVNRLPEGGINWNPTNGGEFLEIAQELTNRGSTEADPVWGFFNNKQITGDVLSLLVQNGTNFLSDDYRRSRIHEPEFMEVVEFLHNLEFKWQVSPDPEQVALLLEAIPEGQTYHAPFAFQRTAMMNLLMGQSGSWGGPDPESLPVVAVKFLSGPQNDKVPSGGRVMEHWGSTENPDEAWDLMRFFLTDKEVNIATFTVLKSGLPPNTTFWDDERLYVKSGRPPREIEAYMATLREGKGYYWQVNGVWSAWIGAYRTGQRAIWAGESTVEEAMQQASKEAQAALDEYYG